MKILITGGAGFIGSHLVQKLKPDHELILLVNDESLVNQSTDNFQFIYQDLTQPLKIEDQEIELIIHLAHLGAFSGQYLTDEVKANENCTRNLIDYGKKNGVKTFVYASSGAVYGFGPQAFKESDPLNPTNDYGKAKVAVEKIIQTAGFKYQISRFFFPYGPGTPKHQLFGKLLDNIKTGGEIIIKNGGEPKTNPTYINDLAQGIIDSLDAEASNILNLAGDETVSIQEIAKLMAKKIGKEPNFKFINEEPNGQNLMADNSLAKKLIGFNPKTTLEEGIDRLITINHY